jgi:tetratricopeptide (TPR) repeat protein
VRALDRDGAWRWAAAGAATGLAALARPNALLFAAAIGAWALLRPGFVLRRRVPAVLAFAAGVLALVLPATWHNARVGGDFVLVSYAGGMNLYIGNNPDARGEFRVPRIVPSALADDPEEQRAVFAALAERASGRALAPSEVSAFWARRALDFVREQPGAWARLMLYKVLLSFNAYEPWNVRSLTLARESSSVLRLPLLGFGVVAPFAVIGLVATRRSWQRLVPLYAWLATVWLTLWVFFVLARYRVAALPVLVLFAAAGVVALVGVLRAGRVPARIGVGLALAALAVAVHWPLARENLGTAYYNLANRFRAQGDLERAIEAYHESMRRSPGYLSAYNNLALAYEEAGRRDEAVAAWNALLVRAQRQGSPKHVERAERRLRALAAKPAPEP